MVVITFMVFITFMGDTSAIKLISYLFHRNLRGEKQELHARNRKTSSQLPSPPNFRLRHRLSSPVLTYRRKISPPGTPDKDARLRSSSTSQVRNSTCRLALPSRVPPLGGKRVLTPELRSTITPELAQENISFVPEVVDLGTYEPGMIS